MNTQQINTLIAIGFAPRKSNATRKDGKHIFVNGNSELVIKSEGTAYYTCGTEWIDFNNISDVITFLIKQA